MDHAKRHITSRAQGDETPPIPDSQDLAASQAFRPIFERLLQRNEELLRLRNQAEQLLSTAPASSFDGLSHLLDELLPQDPGRMRQIAEALRLSQEILMSLRASALDPIHLPVAPITNLGRMINLDFDAFSSLLERDHARFVENALAREVRNETTPEESLKRFRSAWERAEQDDPPHE